MKKQKTITLDWDDDLTMNDDIAFVFFHTTVPGYAFADDLNRLFQLALARQNDLELKEQNWPFYTYRDTMAKLTYHLVDRPAGSDGTAPHWSEGEKLLIVQGEGAQDRAQRLCDAFGSLPEPDPFSSPAAEERMRILAAYQQALMPVNTFIPSEVPSTPLPRKAAKERAELEALLWELVDLLDCMGV